MTKQLKTNIGGIYVHLEGDASAIEAIRKFITNLTTMRNGGKTE